MTQQQEEQEQSKKQANQKKLKQLTNCNHLQVCIKYDKVVDSKYRCQKCKKYFQTQELGVCFSPCQITYTGEQIILYLCLIKYSIFIFVVFLFAFTLPLSLINSKLASSTNQQFIFTSLSSYTLAENEQLGTLTFFLLPMFVIHSILFLLLSYKIRLINSRNNQLKLFPTNHAILLKFPKSISSEDQVAQSLETWFYSQIKYSPQCLDLLPQLLKDQSQNSQESQSSQSSSQGEPQTLASRLIQKVIFSYNFEQYQNFLQEIEYFSNEIKQQKKQIDGREIQKYLNIYNIKKNIAKSMPFLKYCIVVLKKSKYADYFVQKTTANSLQMFFSPQKYRVFNDGGERIIVSSNIYPTEIYWQKMHLNDAIIFKQSLYSNMMWLLCLTVGSIIQYSLTYLRLSNNFLIQNQIGAIIMSNFIINIILLLFTILIHIFSHRQVFITYELEKKSFIFKILILNIVILVFIPTITYIVQFPHYFYSGEGGLLNHQLINLCIFMLFSMIMMYLPFKNSKIQRDKQFYSTKTIKLQYKLASILTIVSITFLVAPILPIIICIPTGSLIFYYFLEKNNISNFYEQASERGSKLIKQIVAYYYNIFILFLGSFTLFYSFNGSTSYWKIQDVIIIIIICILFLIVRFTALNKLQDKLFGCFNNETQKGDSVDENYSKIKSNFLMQYQDFNFLFNYQLKQSLKNNNYSDRMKIYQQLNTMSKTLSLSLKQKLFSNPDPIMKNQHLQRKNTQQDQVNDIYFQYEQKIKMEKSKPKIPIPPLFKREDSSARKEDNKVEMANFNSIFSDSEQKKKVKKTIKTNLKLQNKIPK